jgi:hypothetical protein
MGNDKQRLVELLEKATTEAGKLFRETTKKVLAEKGRFSSKEDIDRRNIYAVEADYLLENGVVVLPCKIGDIVWCNIEEFDRPLKGMIRRVSVSKDFTTIATGVEGYFAQDYLINDFGKTVFLTKEEAEQALVTDKNVGSKKEEGEK